MAFVVSTKRGTFEIRESQSTPKGPRSRTLATFSELDEEAIERARGRAAKPIDAERLRTAARRVGAPTAQAPANRAARELLAEIGINREPEPKLRRLLSAMLGDPTGSSIIPADPSRAVAQWMAATPRDRGKTLVELLLLADALPHGDRRGKPLRFPRLDSTRA
jgi:hypothetical protein